MPNLVASLEGTIARMYAQLGTRWPNPWWPTGVPAYDDCAAAISWALWGLDGDQPYETLVSGVVERSGLTFVAGNQGIRRGDVLGFWWSADVNYDHTELALSSADGDGNVTTIGTNAGPGDDMAVRVRNVALVHNYARPNYISPAGSGGTPFDIRRKKRHMYLSIDTDTHGWLTTDNGAILLTDPRLQTLFRRLINSDQEQTVPETFNSVEQGLMSQQLQLISLQARTGVDIDPVKLAALIAANLPAATSGSVTDEQLHAAFAAAIPVLSKAVNDDAARRLAS